MIEEEENQHTDNKQASCERYNFVMRGIVGGYISVIGIVCNIASLIVFRHGVIKTPTINQLQWLAFVDTILLVLYFVPVAMFYVKNYLPIDDDNSYWQVVFPYMQVYIFPAWRIARTSTNWLTVLFGVYRYLAICKPVSNWYQHVERHMQKYVAIVLSLAALCNIPYFFVRHLSQDNENNVGYDRTNISKSNLFELVYDNILSIAFNVYLPVTILLIVTIKMIVVLRKKQRNMQDSNTSNLNINSVLITILLTFIICQFPFFVYRVLYFIYHIAGIKTHVCGSFDFYFAGFIFVFLILNSAARPFIYMALKYHEALLEK